MKTAIRLLLCAFSFALLSTTVSISATAQINPGVFNRRANDESALQLPQVPQIVLGDFTSLVMPAFRPAFLPPPLVFANDTSAQLYQAITRRLGIRYRFFGTDDRGYDCSGFVWRVFQDAGASFDRVAARTLWAELPEATPIEARQFGTLVFFNGLKHVGIVRDAFSFYHSSRSQGVTLSSFAGYWESRITGFRRAPAPIAEELIEIDE